MSMQTRLGWCAFGFFFILLVAPTAKPAKADAPDAAAILDQIGVKRGIAMVLGDRDGTLATALARASELMIYVQSANLADAAAARRTTEAAGMLGTRVYVGQGDYRRLNLAEDIADTVIAVDSSGGAGEIAEAELLRVLRPDGIALVGTKRIVKPRPAGVDEWAHPYHAPDNNPQSSDQLARRPFLTHFMATPWYCPLPQVTVVSDGRMFKAFGNRSSARPQEEMLNTLIAVNAYNGTMLWKRPLPDDFMIHRNTMIATPTTLFLGDDQSCKLIDAATGEIRDEIVVPADLSDGPVWKWMALGNNLLYALVGEQETSDQELRGDRIRGAGWPWWKIASYKFGFGRTMLAIDPASKEIRWSHRVPDPIDGRAVCLKDGRLYYYCPQKYLVCLEAPTGKVLWKSSDPDLLEAIGPDGPAQNPRLGFASTAYMKCGDEALFFAGPQRPRLVAASTQDGRLLWKRDAGNVQLVLRADGLYALGEGRINEVQTSFKLAPLTGEVLATFPSRDRCTRATGCVDSIFTRGGKGGSTAVFDVTTSQPKMGVISPMRPACQDGVIVFGGHLFWGPWMCRCDMTQLGIISLGPGGDFDYEAAAAEAERLETTPAETIVASLPITAEDWPAFRKDNQRSTYSPVDMPAKVERRWEYTPPSRGIPTAPVMVGDLAFISGGDGAVRAIDAESGQLRWTAYTGGPAKYPPAIWNGRAYAGSADGWVYCFEAATGKSLWRFRAAPTERTIPVYGGLSSTWPVGSGVLVEDGVVYAAAGISNFDGTHVYALDAATGKVRWQNNTSGNPDVEDGTGGVSVQGHLLLHDGAVHMASGNMPTIAAFAVADGKLAPSSTGRGKDLFVRRGQVQATGFPLYWRPEDDHFLSLMELETPAGIIGISTDQVALLTGAPAGPMEKPKAHWVGKPFEEIAAVAVTKNGLLVTGLDRPDKANPQQTSSGLCAFNLLTGEVLWRQPLPAPPVAWGLAIGRSGRIIVTLTDGRVTAF